MIVFTWTNKEESGGQLIAKEVLLESGSKIEKAAF